MSALELSGITKSFDGQSVVEGFDLAIAPGRFVSVIGHSGCGKSTVLAIAAGLLRADEGVVKVNGREAVAAGPERGAVFQAPTLFDWLTARGNVALAVEAAFPDAPKSTREALVEENLRRVGLAHVLDKKPSELSLGMKQRVSLARAFALDPKVLLLDEPFGMLDSITRMDLTDLLVEVWSADAKAALMITHDVDEAIFLSDEVVAMTRGPSARIAAVVEIPFARPRDRVALLAEPTYQRVRERLLGLLDTGPNVH